MYIENQFSGSRIFWRMFDATESSYIFGRAEGVVPIGGRIGPLTHPSGRFKLELRRNGLGGAFISAPGPVFSNDDDYVLLDDGSLTRAVVPEPPVEPHALIRRVSGFDVAVHGFPFANLFPITAFPVQEVAGIPITSSAFGLCGGMAYAVRDYFESGHAIPGTATPPIGGPLFDYLWRRLIDSFNLPFGAGRPGRYLDLMNPALPDAGLPVPLAHPSRAWVMTHEEWPKIRATIDADRLCPIALVLNKTSDVGAIFDNHQVVVYGYEVRGSDITLLIYDPNTPKAEQTLRFDISDPQSIVEVGYAPQSKVWCFFATDYVFSSPPEVPAHSWDSGWRSIGRMVFSSPDVASMSADHLAVFARGIEGAVWTAETNGSTWSSWESLGGVVTSDPTAVSWGPGRVDVFARGTDNALYQNTKNGQWSGWTSLGGVLTSGPDAASWGPGRLDVFVRGTDNGIHHQSFDGGWSGWESLGGDVTSDPAAVSWGPGRLDLFARGADGRLVHKWFDNGQWSDWESLGGVLVAGPDVASWGPGHLAIFVRGTDNQLHQLTYENGWKDWTALGGALTSDPAAVSTRPDQLSVVARGLDAGLWIKHYT